MKSQLAQLSARANHNVRVAAVAYASRSQHLVLALFAALAGLVAAAPQSFACDPSVQIPGYECRLKPVDEIPPPSVHDFDACNLLTGEDC